MDGDFKNGSDDHRLLLVDSESRYAEDLAMKMEARGFSVVVAIDFETGLLEVLSKKPAYAIIDVLLNKRGGGFETGLKILEKLKKVRPDVRVIILSRYMNVENAVAAMNLGAVDCLTKPSDSVQLLAALTGAENPSPAINDRQALIEHTLWAFLQYGEKMSLTAERLGMNERTLQRRLRSITQADLGGYLRETIVNAVPLMPGQSNRSDRLRSSFHKRLRAAIT